MFGDPCSGGGARPTETHQFCSFYVKNRAASEKQIIDGLMPTNRLFRIATNKRDISYFNDFDRLKIG